MIEKDQLQEDLYPMNQDRIDFGQLMYANSVDYIAGHIKRKGQDIDAAIAQVEKDLRMMLDQRFRGQ
jgi:N12 class adenine-specific DNA methylase